ncbi:LemA family protein [Rhodanobacter lindaniclasticus]
MAGGNGVSVTEIVAWTVSIIALMYLVLIYNNLVQLKYNVAKAWANIDVLLKQRHDELPQLVAVCKQYMRHERDTLEQLVKVRAEVSSARNLVNLKELGLAEQQMRDVLNHLFALAENYPDLKADALFNHLQVRITGLENAIADRRELYNDSVNLFRIRVDQFPDVVVARLFRFRPGELLRFSARELRNVDVKALFG